MRGKLARNLLLFLIFFLALILQTTILPLFKIRGMMADLLLILVIFTALCTGPVTGAVTGLTVGLVVDLLGGRAIGISALSGFLTGYLIGLLEGKVYKQNLLLPLILVFTGTLIYNGIFFLGESIRSSFPYDFPFFWRSAIPGVLYNTVLAAFLYHPFLKCIIGDLPDEVVQTYGKDLYR